MARGPDRLSPWRTPVIVILLGLMLILLVTLIAALFSH
jgi:hypothetical protein